MSKTEQMWFENPWELVHNGNAINLWPDMASPLPNQLNAVMRISILFGLVVLIVRRSFTSLFFPILVGVVTYMIATLTQEHSVEKMSTTSHPACTTPSRNNPFMNVLISDYTTDPDRPQACDLSNNDRVLCDAESHFSHDLYRDVDDVFQRRASSRNFYTTPNTTIPNDQTQFASWLYLQQSTCKEGDGDACSLRLHRFVPGT